MLLQKNVEINELTGAYEITEYYSRSRRDIEYYYNISRASFILTTVTIFKETISLLSELRKNTVFAFKSS